MAVSVRMPPLLEHELELAAQKQGISKSQFIIDAVERALGRKDPGQLLLQVRQEFAAYRVDSPPEAEAAFTNDATSDDSPKQKVKELLRAKHEARLADWQVFQDEQALAKKSVKKVKGSQT